MNSIKFFLYFTFAYTITLTPFHSYASGNTALRCSTQDDSTIVHISIATEQMEVTFLTIEGIDWDFGSYDSALQSDKNMIQGTIGIVGNNTTSIRLSLVQSSHFTQTEDANFLAAGLAYLSLEYESGPTKKIAPIICNPLEKKIAVEEIGEIGPGKEFPAAGFSVGGRFRTGPGTEYDQPFNRNFRQPIEILADSGVVDKWDDGTERRWFRVKTEQGEAFQPASFLCSTQKTISPVIRICDSDLVSSSSNQFPTKGYSYGGRFRTGPGIEHVQAFNRNFPQPVEILADSGVEDKWQDGKSRRWFRVKTRQGEAFQPGAFLCTPDNKVSPYINVCRSNLISAAKANSFR